MDTAKRKRLEAAGWVLESTAEFLNLSVEEMNYIELRVRLGDALKEQRTARQLSQAALATIVGANPALVAKMEAGAPSASIDHIIRALLALGISSKKLAKIVAPGKPAQVRMRKAKKGVTPVLLPKLPIVTHNPALT